jgi:riboflavin biosynthesis pyrimidine reductase
MDISSPMSFRLLHSLRAKHDAILVGINTVVADNPQLNVREPLPGVDKTHPRPIVIDSDLKILNLPSKLRLSNPIVCTCLEPSSERWSAAVALLQSVNGSLLTCHRDDDGR